MRKCGGTKQHQLDDRRCMKITQDVMHVIFATISVCFSDTVSQVKAALVSIHSNKKNDRVLCLMVRESVYGVRFWLRGKRGTGCAEHLYLFRRQQNMWRTDGWLMKQILSCRKIDLSFQSGFY